MKHFLVNQLYNFKFINIFTCVWCVCFKCWIYSKYHDTLTKIHHICIKKVIRYIILTDFLFLFQNKKQKAKQMMIQLVKFFFCYLVIVCCSESGVRSQAKYYKKECMYHVEAKISYYYIRTHTQLCKCIMNTWIQ